MLHLKFNYTIYIYILLCITFSGCHKNPPGLIQVAASLDELGYLREGVSYSNPSEISKALKSYQKDIGYSQTGVIDDKTWAKLSKVDLSEKIKERMIKETEKASKTANISDEKTENKTKTVASPEIDTPTNKNAPKVKYIKPETPEYAFGRGDEVYVLEKIECKKQNEVWLLFYQGKIKKLNTASVTIAINKRYAMIYDNRYEGISTKDWSCIPNRRFCFSQVQFRDWGGELETGELFNQILNLVMPVKVGLAPLAIRAIKKTCHDIK